MKHKKAIKAAKTLKKYCKKRKCKKCVFRIDGDCMLTAPIQWRIKRLKNEKRQID